LIGIYAYRTRFRWVSCQLDHLCELPTDALRRKALTQLPKTLHETYERILMRVQEHTVPLVRKTLQWIIHAERKLNVEELVEIISLEDDDDRLDSEAYPDPEDLLRSCGSLIREVDGCLELAHFTVQEFLEAIKPDDERLSLFRISTADKLILAKACVSYLCLRTFDQPPVMLFNRDKNNYPFYIYASGCLPVYASLHQDDIGFFEQIQELFDPEKSYNFTLFMLEHLDECSAASLSGDQIDIICSPAFGPLHAAAMLHMHKVCKWLVDKKCDVNKISPFGVPLECAMYGTASVIPKVSERHFYRRHLRDTATQVTISVLLDAGAACDGEMVHGNSLRFVLSHGPEDLSGLFAMMLKRGMPLQSDIIPLLSEISYQQRELFFQRIVVLKDYISISPEVRIHLLDFARTNKLTTSISMPFAASMTDSTFSEAFRHAVKFDQVSAFEKLVNDSRLSVELAHVGESGTHLHLAAKNKSVKMLHRLLDLGCDPIEPDKLGRSVLHEVIRSGIDDERLLCRLISSKAAKVLDVQGRTVWHEAACEGHLQSLQILFDTHGSHTPLLHQPCKKGYTPILEAILGQHSECALLLLSETCIDNVIIADVRTLHYAVAMGLHSFLESLRDHGAELCTVSEQKQTALYSLTSYTKSDTMDLLLTCGLNPHHLDVYGRPPLVALLALDERRDHIRLNCLEDLENCALQRPIVEALASNYSVGARDIDGHTSWFYFCTRLIPSILSSNMVTKQIYLTDILSILTRYGACKVYEEATGTSGIILLAKMCLDSFYESYESSDILWPDINNARDVEFAVAAVSGVLRGICTIISTMNIANDPHIIRLLAWSIAHSQRLLIETILDLGADVHSVSGYHGRMTPIDESIVLDVDSDILDLLLERADTSQLLTVDEEGELIYFCLCCAKSGSRPKNRIAKLEALLKAGVDPNVRSPNSRTMAHTAARSGSLEALQLLVRFKADLGLADRHGWTVVQHAVTFGDPDLLIFVREHLTESTYWKATFSCSGPTSRTENSASGPLPLETYFGCNLLHLASICTRGTDTLQLLQETGYFDNLDATTHEGAAPLHFAACIESPSATNWLISHGANIHICMGRKKRTALHHALRLGYLENALALIEAGATFTADSEGYTPEMEVHEDIRGQLITALPHCRVCIPPSVLENLRSENELRPLGGLHRAIMEGNYQACLLAAQGGKPLTRSMLECGTCTPLIVALASGELDIAEAFLSNGSSADGFPCAETQSMGPLFHSALNIAISQPIFNSILGELLNLIPEHEGHWTQGADFWQPLHLAAAHNAKGIEILVRHINKHKYLISYVTSS
jgi:ankyrin repeat protein